METNTPSKRYSLNGKDGARIFKVLVWSGISAVLAGLLTMLPQIEFPPQVALFVPIINTALFTLVKFAQQQSK